MEVSSSSNIMDNQRLPQLENVTDFFFPAAEYEVPNPHGDDLTLDRETRRRLLNRGYSKTHREKTKCHIENLEDKKNSLSDIICKEVPMFKVYTNFNSVIKSKINTLEETLSQVNSNGEVVNVEMDKMINTLEQLRLSKEATEAEFIRKKKGGK
ncbi:unnamed protein product [Lathyrus oleraceus]